MIAIAWDIETCPLPTEELPPSHEARHDKELAHQKEQNPEINSAEASKRARSFHPYLGWISCISVVRGSVGEEMGEPYSWTASTPGKEEEMLRDFWEAVGQIKGSPRWATFSGKDFDVPFLTARTSRHGLTPSRDDLIDTYPFSHDPHVDLSKVWLPVNSSLEEMCAHLGVQSPKGNMDGSDVAQAVSEGRMEEVARYCEGDATATLRCLSALQWAL